ncbi:helix-turn-helix transcriptional regulator [Stenotrophomonas maltophilia]|jgi:DNA-binding HxlR family transcriptional regulator|uniref:winged helix-turn-helix transcriptional regulator n=1 Tax=Stenotrophomonas TaxID=40323 RepID=UPI00066CD391|nr:MULTISPECIES: helix-turn-helix domain-containing protein [Stenotrophomonas]KPG86916.1 HxlR family transcriptional regulator [Stenotrophomonas maltophilia]MBA0242150.1 transcriptional regulator [Stenotrophomonas maltophilia]MBA0246553.1 transcriptional regulator [Stenotrophomonas maltophilia]MBA0305954.1 transcriptional regulator [Stenotrophomonas maltophilia]MBA0437583.1 transcriptional regulator [Stenotrophomonas maltophilia]
MGLKVRKSQAQDPGSICPLTKCMALLAGAWTAEIVWSLSAGPRRFGELRIDLAPVTAKTLTARLRDMQLKGMITRHERDTSPPSIEYALTALGAQLLPAIHAIARVGNALKFGEPEVG